MVKSKIQVFILRHDAPHRSHISHLNMLLHDRIFDVELKAGSGPLEERILDCLKESWRNDPNSHCLILTDRVISTHTGKSLADILKKCLEIKDFDLAYLFKHNDRCQMHSEITTTGATSIVNCHSPHGLEAILYSPSGRDILLGKKMLPSKTKFNCKKGLENMLNKHIYEGDLRAIATTPNLFEYDTVNNSTKACHYEYRNECAPLQLQPPAATLMSSRIVVILAFILVLIIVTTWALLQLGNCPTKQKC